MSGADPVVAVPNIEKTKMTRLLVCTEYVEVFVIVAVGRFCAQDQRS